MGTFGNLHNLSSIPKCSGRLLLEEYNSVKRNLLKLGLWEIPLMLVGDRSDSEENDPAPSAKIKLGIAFSW